MSGRALIIHTNPWPLWVAVERDIAFSLVDRMTVDAVDVIRLLGGAHVDWGKRDRLYEAFSRKYKRFLVPALNGRDITGELTPHGADLPLPETVPELRAFRIGESRVGLAALSSTASISRIASQGRTADYGSMLERAWRSALRAQSLAEQIASRGYDAVYLFNGRPGQSPSST